jgi:DNA invertase Pin-like site-specific DNA recombinase
MLDEIGRATDPAWTREDLDAKPFNLQTDALRGAGAEKIFSDAMSGSRNDRPGLREALEFARPGDCLCVWRLDRLAAR